MNTKLILLLTIPVQSSAKTYAGWYNTYNYSGTIGTDPIILSLQFKECYFGETTKKGYSVIGVYRYVRYNMPIRLVGVFDHNTNKISIHEYPSYDKVSATFFSRF